jgi:cytochrome b subunit of formate dehydrogenase
MEHNSIIGMIPWPVTAATAAWFGIMAYKAGKNCVVWAIGGGVLALVVTTIVMGLAQATFIPYYTDEIATFRLVAAGVAIVLVLCLGWLFTGTLHQHIRELLKRSEQAAPEAPAQAPVVPPGTSPKP